MTRLGSSLFMQRQQQQRHSRNGAMTISTTDGAVWWARWVDSLVDWLGQG